MGVKQTHIGGQAVIEGVMMRGKKMYTLAVRGPNKDIITEDVQIESANKKKSFTKLPIIRGMVSFVQSLIIGTKIITRSAELAGMEDEDDGEISKFEQFIVDKLGDKVNDVLMFVSVAISIVLSIGLFMVLPVLISGLIRKVFYFESKFLLSLLEGIVKIIIFLAYIYLISKMKEIERVFMYHGAEHKTINCFEHGEELTIENVKKHTRLHKRCGTSFLFIVMAISILVFMLLPSDVIWFRVLSRIILIPFIAGFSFEVIKWAGSNDSPLVNLLSKPGLSLQKITTNEPTDDQIEVAIAAMKGVLESEGND